MPGRLGPRFAIEAGFLVLLAAGAGVAGLSPIVIVAVMAVTWLLVALIEWAISREESHVARYEHRWHLFLPGPVSRVSLPYEKIEAYPIYEFALEEQTSWVLPSEPEEEAGPDELSGDPDAEPTVVGRSKEPS